MRKTLLTFSFLMLLVLTATAQKSNRKYAMYGIAFYNLENLFNTLHDDGKNDYEYLPDGNNKWGKLKYENKTRNMARVLSELCTEKIKVGPAVIGLSEIENRQVLEDVLKEPTLSGRGWEICHEEGPDRRGVDCAFFYNPKMFKYESHMLVPYFYLDENQPDVDLGFYVDENNKVVPYTELKGDTAHITRGFLVMTGTLAGEKFHFIACHWPSRFAGSPVRERAGDQVYALKEALLKQDPGSHIVIMGDLNDDPDSPSLAKSLKCKYKQEDAGPSDMYNPWKEMLRDKGQGTLLYGGQWNLFDQIIISGNLLGRDRRTLKFLNNRVFVRDYLFQQEGRYKGGPLRTHAGGTWLNGYSDHLPTFIYLVKEIQK